MLEKLLAHLDSLFYEIQFIEAEYTKKNLTLPQAHDLAKKACSLQKNPCSELQVIHGLYLEVDKLTFNHYEFSMGIEKLLRKYSMHDHYTVVKKATDGPYGRLIDITKTTFGFLQKIPTEIYLKELENIEGITKISSLQALTQEHLANLKNLIQTEIFDHVAIHSYVKAEKEVSPSKYELSYYQKWIDGTITYSDVSKNTFYDFRSYINDQKLPYEHIEKIEKKQEQLFEEGLFRYSRDLITDIEELEEPKRSLLIRTHISLLERFLSGDTDEVLLKRINNFIKLDDPIDVLLEYDTLLQSDFYDYSNLSVFQIGVYRRFSSTFTAHLIYLYLQTLKRGFNEQSKKNPTPKKTSKSDRIAFHFKGEPSRLRSVLTALQLKIDLLKDKDQIESLVSVLTSVDARQEKMEIHLDCETQQFAYIITQLKPFFTRLTASGIEETKSFYSKNGKPITANNLHGRPPKGVKKQGEIDNIIKQLR